MQSGAFCTYHHLCEDKSSLNVTLYLFLKRGYVERLQIINILPIPDCVFYFMIKQMTQIDSWGIICTRIAWFGQSCNPHLCQSINNTNILGGREKIIAHSNGHCLH